MAAADKPSLIDAARRVFEEHGYAGATLERIAEAAGVSRVTLHRHGVTKEGLLTELASRGTQEYREAMWPVLTASGSGAERLRRALETLCGVAEEQMGLLLALRSQADRVFHGPGEEALTRTEYTEPLERLIRDGIADGSLRDADPAETATVLFNMVGWTYIHLRAGHGWKPERATRAVVDAAFSGIAASDRASAG